MNTVVALPIVAAVPTIAPAMPAEMHPIADPVFAAIDNHKKAMQSLQAANAESNRVMDLADEAVGPSSIKVLDMREPSTPPGFHPYVEVNWLGDIEQYVPEAEYPELYALYRAELNERNAARAQFLEDNFGDTDKS